MPWDINAPPGKTTLEKWLCPCRTWVPGYMPHHEHMTLERGMATYSPLAAAIEAQSVPTKMYRFYRCEALEERWT